MYFPKKQASHLPFGDAPATLDLVCCSLRPKNGFQATLLSSEVPDYLAVGKLHRIPQPTMT